MIAANNKPFVIHVDDDENYLDLFCITFNKYLNIESISDANEALRCLENHIPDVIITDYDMPELNGLELLQVIKTKKPELPVILCTAQGNEQVAREAFILGASDYFTKELFQFAHKEKLINSIKKAAEIRKTSSEKRKSDIKYKTLFNNAVDFVILHHLDEKDAFSGKIVELNNNARLFFGCPKQKAMDNPFESLIHPHYRSKLPHIIEELKDKDYIIFETLFVSHNGNTMPVEISIHAFDMDGESMAISVARNITDRKQQEERILHLNRVLLAIRNVNQTIVTEKNRDKLLQKICDSLIESRGYEKAVIFLTDSNGTAFLSKEANNLSLNDLSNNNTIDKLPEKCLKTSLLSNKICICEINDISQSQVKTDDKPIKLSMSLRLEHKNKVYGVLSVFLTSSHSINDEEQSLFYEVAGDIAYALNNLEIEQEKEELRQKLAQREEMLTEVIENIKSGIAVYEPVDDGKDFIFTAYNKAGEEMSQYNRADVLGKSLLECFPNIKEFGLFDIFQQVNKTGIPMHFPAKEYKDHRFSGWRECYTYKLSTGHIVSIFDDVTPWIESQAALKKSEERFRNLFDNIKDPVFLCRYDNISQDLKFIEVNESAANIYDFAKEEMSSITLKDITISYCENTAKLIINNLLNQKQFMFEALHKTKEGEEIPVEINANLIYIDGEEYILASARDISQRKKTELQLKNLNTFLTTMNLCSQEIISSKTEKELIENLCGIIVNEGDYLLALIGLQQNNNQFMTEIHTHLKLSQQEITTIKSDWFLNCCEKSIAHKVLSEGKPIICNDMNKDYLCNEFRHKTEFLQYGSLMVLPITHNNISMGVVIMFSKRKEAFTPLVKDHLLRFSQDLSYAIESIRNKRKLMNTEQKYRNLLNLVNEGIWKIDPEGYTLYVNEKAARMLGYTSQEMTGKHINNFMSPDKTKEAETYLSRRQSGIFEEHSFEFLHKDGSIKHVSLHTAPMYNDNNQYIGAYGVLMDSSQTFQKGS